MTINELLNELSEQGVKLWTDGEQLRIRANKGVITPEKREIISEHKAEILEQLRQNNVGASTTSLPVIVPQPDKRYEPFPMTDIQYAFWVGRMGVLELGHVANHGYYEIEAVGLNLERLNQALNQLIQRHDMLRAIMLSEGLQQVLEKVPTYEMSTLDLRGEDEDVAQARISEVRDIMSHQVLPADKWPLFQFRASILEQQRFRLHISYDLQIFDAWSMMRLFEEWFELYENPECLLKPLEITFRDYVLAEQGLENTELYERSRQYWLNRIDSLPPAPDLPLAVNPNSIKDYQCQRFSGKLDKTNWQKLKKRAGEAGLTPSAVLLAAFADVLTLWGKNSQFTMNLALFNRLPLHPQVNNILGDFTSVTLLAVDNSATETFTKRALRLQRQLWQDLEHRYFSGVRVMREINRRQGQAPTAMPVVFTSAIGFDALGQETSSLFRFGELVYAISQASQIWMDHQVSEQNGELVFTWDAVTALFPEGMISDMFDAYYCLIRNLATSDVAWNETTRQGMMPVKQLLQRKNINATEKPICDGTLYGLFAKQVQVRGNEVAVISSSRSLSYHQLSELSIQLGVKLQQLGAAPNKLVAIVMEKGWEQIVGVLGVLAAGAAYVPINPKEAKERLQYLLDNSKAEIVLTQSWLTDLALPDNIKRIDVDTFSPSPTDNFLSPVTVYPDDLAYLIYTSGSTGLPKGVMITHQKAVNTMVYTNQRFNVGVKDRMLAVTALHHDMSVYDIFGLLSAGGTIVMPDAARIKDPYHWIELINSKQVTMWNSVPAMMEMLVESALSSHLSLPSSFRIAFWGGDWISLSLPKRLRTLVNDVEIISVGGPTETTVWNICYSIKEVEPSWKSIPYGQPMTNSKYYILNENLEDCPMWVPGQMYCAGVQVAKGYWRNEEKTNSSFITHPRTGERIYGTGDLGRYLPDGNIEFVGRVDFQIKIRGHRVETGEIEAALTKHSGVKSAVVKAFGKDEKQRLVAYLILSQKPEPTIAEISQFLQDKLPEYMIPSAYIFLDKFPLSANGKIDRRSLPQPEGNLLTIETNYVAPQTKIEKIIVEIWQEVLELEKVGIKDNFFDVGGNSLQVTKIYNQLRKTLPNESQNISLVDVFKYPTISELSEKLDHNLKQLTENSTQFQIPTIQPIPRNEQPLDLSWTQERLWFLNQLEGQNATYNIPGAFWVKGNLDINALQLALSEIVRRHEVLHTSFPTQNGQPIQVINPDTTININIVDFQQLEPTKRETIILQEVQKEAITPFNLEIAPLVRCSLLQLSTTESVLLLTMHHIVSDGWSIGIFIQELSSLYQAFTKGEPSSLAELPIQYADFAAWQKQYLSGEILETQLNYWKQNLANPPELLQLPTDRPRPTSQTYQGATHCWTIETELTEKLQNLSRQNGTTLFMTILAAFATLLYRYSGQSDILIGSPIANRNRSEIEPLIGSFVNTLVLRTAFVDDPSFEELLAQVKETTLKAYQNQDVPFERVVEALQPQRSLSHSPLFQVMLVQQNAPMNEVELPGVSLSFIKQKSTIARFDLTLSIMETESGIVGEWEYNTDLFDSSTIERTTVHLQNLLDGIVENSAQKISELPILSAVERHQLLVEWNNTEVEYPKDKCIHQLFEQQVEKTPDAVAVVFEQQQLTYQELNAQANQLANYLQSLGVKPDTLVGICVERSVEMVIGLLGILKAGGAYVPLDPNYPQERLSYMLNDSEVKVLLTQSSLLASLPTDTAQVICLDTDWDVIEQYNLEYQYTGVCSDNLAYVIYTSGSTGKPKGVAIEHFSLCNLAQAQANLFDVKPSSRVLQFASFSFDASVWEIFMALTKGAVLILGKTPELMPGLDLQQTLHQYEVTHVTLPPSALSVLPTDELPFLSHIVVAGEACSMELINQWSVGRRFFNAYGPTESTVCATVAPIDHGSEKVTIGRPIANSQIYILDEQLQLLPIGVPGELYIGGDGLARGYLNRPELTSQKFIQNPFSNSQSERIYRTGDLARYNNDGNIEYLGRIDNLVKLRGFRVELGEIESVLSSHPQVQQTIVICREDIPGNKQLVAYIVSTEAGLNSTELRLYLQSKLPEYMVPSAFILLETLPLTPNGKIDRKALPAPDIDSNRSHEYVPPQTETEKQIATVLQEVLQLEKVSIYDNFFELGANSLILVKINNKLQEILSIELPLVDMFTYPNIKALSQHIANVDNSKTLSELPQLDRNQIKSTLKKRRQLRQQN